MRQWPGDWNPKRAKQWKCLRNKGFGHGMATCAESRAVQMARRHATIAETYMQLRGNVQVLLDETSRVRDGWTLTLTLSNKAAVVPIVPKIHKSDALEVAARMAA